MSRLLHLNITTCSQNIAYKHLNKCVCGEFLDILFLSKYILFVLLYFFLFQSEHYIKIRFIANSL